MNVKTRDGLNFADTVSLNIDGRDRVLNFRYRYHPFLGQWRLSVYDGQSGACYLMNIPLLYTGARDLIAPFAYRGIGRCYVYRKVQEAAAENPTEENFGIEYGLAWGGSSDG